MIPHMTGDIVNMRLGRKQTKKILTGQYCAGAEENNFRNTKPDPVRTAGHCYR